MSRLTYKTVFSKYETSFSHKLSQKAYSTYKFIKLFFSKKYPLKDYEKYRFEECNIWDDLPPSEMPKGYSRVTKQEEEGKIELKYLDFFDYLPKEDAESFKKALRKFARSNEIPKFSSFRTHEDDDRIDHMGRYVDGRAFSNLHSIVFSHSKYLKKYASQVNVSIHNLSASFLLVKYRVYISNAFNEELQTVYREQYGAFSDVLRQFNIPWYKPWKFGRSMYSGDEARRKAVYLKLSKLKWMVYKEIKKYFKIYFSDDLMFPPVFTTYHTNIPPSSGRETLDFWCSIGLDYESDYSQQFNLCVGWDEGTSENQGVRLSAFCGGSYKDGERLPEIAEYECAEIYCVYMVASTIRCVAERDIATCNKKISRAIRKSGSSKLLKVRAKVEKKLYYEYRFMSEFSGASIELSDIPSFRNPYQKDCSRTQSCLTGISEHISKTKQRIDAMLHLLDDAVEYQTAKSNMALQWLMMAITVLSLVVATIALTDVQINLDDIWTSITGWFRNIFK